MTEPACSFDGCIDVARGRGLCYGHLAQHYQKGELRPKRGSQPKQVCKFPDCGRSHAAHGWCRQHEWQSKNRPEMWPIGSRARAHRMVTGCGYVKVYRPDHPNAQKRGWVMEHVAVMTEHLGRPLVAGENIHHINGDRSDNRLKNLELWSTRQPKGQRVTDKVDFALDILRLYRPEVLRE